MPAPIVYPANAHKIGLLEEDAMDVVTMKRAIELLGAEVAPIVRKAAASAHAA